MPTLSLPSLEKTGGGFNKTLKKLADTVSEFFRKIIDTAVGFFQTMTTRLKTLKFSPKAKTQKVEVPAKYQKLFDQGKISAKKLEGCKTPEDVEKVVSEYRKKKVAIMAGTAVGTMGAAAAVALVVNRVKARKKELLDARKKELAQIKAATIVSKGQQKQMNEKAAAAERIAAVRAKVRANIEFTKDMSNAEMDLVTRLVKQAEHLAAGDAPIVANAGYSAKHEEIARSLTTALPGQSGSKGALKNLSRGMAANDKAREKDVADLKGLLSKVRANPGDKALRKEFEETVKRAQISAGVRADMLDAYKRINSEILRPGRKTGNDSRSHTRDPLG